MFEQLARHVVVNIENAYSMQPPQPFGIPRPSTAINARNISYTVLYGESPLDVEDEETPEPMTQEVFFRTFLSKVYLHWRLKMRNMDLVPRTLS